MTEKQDSLVQRDEQQALLFSGDALAPHIFESSEKLGEFTGERLFKSYPEKYRAIVALSAEGVGIIRQGKLLGVSPNTIMAVQAREGVQIEIVKEKLAGVSRAGARLCVEGIVEALADDERRAKIPPRDLAVIFGILVDKSELLSGGVTARIHVINDGEPTHEAYLAMMAELGAMAARMGSGEGNAGQKGDPVAAARTITVESSEVKREA